MPDRLKKALVANPLSDRTVMRRIITPVDPDNPPEGFQEARVMFFIGGGRASGKTTVNNYLFELLEGEGISRDYVGKLGSYAFEDILDNPMMQRMRHRINDYLAKNASASATDGAPVDDAAPKKAGLGSAFLDHAVDTIFKQGSPVVVDNHMDDPAFVDKLLEKAHEHGYETVMISPHISPETYFAREQHRFETTGRPFDTQSGLVKHVGFAQGLPHYEHAFDATLLLDNDTHGQAPTPISYSVGGEVTILNEGKYHDARRKTDINVHAGSPDDVWQNITQGDRTRAAGDGQDAVTRSQSVEPGARANEVAGALSGVISGAAGKGATDPAGQWSQQVLSHYIGKPQGGGRGR